MVGRKNGGTAKTDQLASESVKRAEIRLPGEADRHKFEQILESAARLQRLVPDAVLVDGSAGVPHAGHRLSLDHDDVLADLRDRFDAVLDDIEDDEGWQLNRITPGKVILGELDGVETGVRQMRRERPLEVEQFALSSGAVLTAPTIEEALRVKAFLAVQRNQVCDYLDIAALADRLGVERAASVLASIDAYYADQRSGDEAVASQVARQLADPRPKDTRTVGELARYKGLLPPWTSWDHVRGVLGQVAESMALSAGEGEE